MTAFVYPRLSTPIALKLLDEVQNAYRLNGLDGVNALSAVSHPRAAPVPTGGLVAQARDLEKLRASVDQAVKPWLETGLVPRSEVGQFDLQLGKALHKGLGIVPADAANDTTWNFLTLVVFPHVAVIRFPSLHKSRMLGLPRNALRRTWHREDVIGDILDLPNGNLGEDILVGLFERTSLARNRLLLREIALALVNYTGPYPRSMLARKLSRVATWSTGLYFLDVLEADQLRSLISEYIELAEKMCSTEEP